MSKKVIVTQETVAALEKLFDAPPDDPWIAELRRNTEPAVCTFDLRAVYRRISRLVDGRNSSEVKNENLFRRL